MSTAESYMRERTEREAQALAELEKLREQARPKPVELEEDAEKRAAQLAEIFDGFDPRSPAEIKARIQSGLAAFNQGMLGTQLGETFFELLESRALVGPDDIEGIERKAAGLIDWAEAEFARNQPSGRVISRKGVNLGPRGSRVTTSFSDGRQEIERRSAEEVAALEAERVTARDDAETFGTRAKDGSLTITVEDVRGMTASQWLSLPADVREGLLRGQDQSGVRLEERTGTGGAR